MDVTLFLSALSSSLRPSPSLVRLHMTDSDIEILSDELDELDSGAPVGSAEMIGEVNDHPAVNKWMVMSPSLMKQREKQQKAKAKKAEKKAEKKRQRDNESAADNEEDDNDAQKRKKKSKGKEVDEDERPPVQITGFIHVLKPAPPARRWIERIPFTLFIL
ncbi:hypothetical protein B0H13DRAFT_2653642, partial [Mycena leptocephala]